MSSASCTVLIYRCIAGERSKNIMAVLSGKYFIGAGILSYVKIDSESTDIAIPILSFRTVCTIEMNRFVHFVIS